MHRLESEAVAKRSIAAASLARILRAGWGLKGLNLIEVWFGLVERKVMRLSVSKPVPDLNTRIHAYIEGWNKRSHLFGVSQIAEDTSRVSTASQLKIHPLMCKILLSMDMV